MVTPADYKVLVCPDGQRILVGTTEEANHLPVAYCTRHKVFYPRDFGCPDCEVETFGDHAYLPDAEEINAVLVAESNRKEILRRRQAREWRLCVLITSGIALAIVGAALVWAGGLP